MPVAAFSAATMQPLDLRVFSFPGGEPHVSFGDGPLPGEVMIDARIGSFDDLGAVLVLNDALVRHGCRVTLFCPYLPGARQDRGAPLTAKVVADVINLGRFDRVIGLDPHSDVMPALVDRFVAVGPDRIAQSAPVRSTMFDGASGVICPDAGAVKRTELVAAALGLPVVYARKHRDFATGALSGFTCDAVDPAATYVVVDDICDGGGTFLGLADVIGLPAPQLRLWVSHGIFSKGATALHERFGRIGCTDSFPAGPDARAGVDVFPALAPAAALVAHPH
jgi:ribose-phosphate pyrophosphokinase